MQHYYSKNQESDFKPILKSIRTKNSAFYIYTASGIFSKDGLDKGTELLIDSYKLPKTGRILDLGCGYGAIGISILVSNPDLSVVFCDTNKRAENLTIMGLKKNNIQGDVIVSDGFENVPGVFDCIISNLPYSAGRNLCLRLIDESYDHISIRGTLQVVAVHNKGGKFISDYMNNKFGNVKETAKSSGYRVYLSKK